MSAVPQELSETTSQMFASMDQARSQSVPATAAEGSISTLVAYTIAIPSTVALVISAYLAYATFTMSDVAGCGGGSIFDCGHVLHSKWSKAAGIPVSVFAFITHATLIGGLFATISHSVGKAGSNACGLRRADRSHRSIVGSPLLHQPASLCTETLVQLLHGGSCVRPDCRRNGDLESTGLNRHEENIGCRVACGNCWLSFNSNLVSRATEIQN